MSRLTAASEKEFICATQPFSSFLFVDDRFDSLFPIRRLFDIARTRDYQSIVIEAVAAEASVADENKELKRLFKKDYIRSEVRRITFWCKNIRTEKDLASADSNDLICYGLLKKDEIRGRGPQWHIFEAVVALAAEKNHHHTSQLKLEVVVGNHRFELKGIPYCQQNGLNKSCAQVALRTLCSVYLQNPDLHYSRINRAARRALPLLRPAHGVKPRHIAAVLTDFDIPFDIVDYGDPTSRRKAYQPVLYSGVESGAGSIFAFAMNGRGAERGIGHVIPLYGHTFNQHAWAPVANGEYFQIGNKIRYFSSEGWASDFICHDDNLGANFHLPKNFVDRKRANLAIALRPRGFLYAGRQAEVMASQLLFAVIENLPEFQNKWIGRLKRYVARDKVILRTVATTSAIYVKHLSTISDWNNHKENPATINFFRRMLPKKLWIVEISIPDLFTTNQRKFGEMVFDATKPYNPADPYPAVTHFLMARLPGQFAFVSKVGGRKRIETASVESKIADHTALLTEQMSMI